MQSNFNSHCELNYHDQKIRQTLTRDIQKRWTPVSTLFGLISCVYWRSNQPPQIRKPKLYNWANSPYRTQVSPNQLVMETVRYPEIFWYNVIAGLHFLKSMRVVDIFHKGNR